MPAREDFVDRLAEQQICELVVQLLDYFGASEMGPEFERIEADCLFGYPAFLGGRGAVARDPIAAVSAAQRALAPLIAAVKSSAPPRVREARDALLGVLAELIGGTQGTLDF